METAPAGLVEQAHRLARQARLLPADDAAKALEQAVTVRQAAQANILIEAEPSGALRDSGCAAVRSFATTILHRSILQPRRATRRLVSAQACGTTASSASVSARG
jgi:hypothetical protein